jgi:hypothetical protein
MRNERNTMRHPSALTVAKNIHQRKRKIAGTWRKTKIPVQKIGNQQRAPEGVQGL